MSILRRLFGLEPKKTEEPTLDLATKQEKTNESPTPIGVAQVLIDPVLAPVDGVVEAHGQAPAELIATPADPVVVVTAPVATKARKTAASKAPEAKKIKK